MNRIILKPDKEQSLKRFHPWIFSGAINRVEGDIGDGDQVEVFSYSGENIGFGHYQTGSIAVRMLSFSPGTPDMQYWRKKIEKCLKLREECGLAINRQTNCYRLVNAEGDGLPGLIIDYYNGTAVIQAHSTGMHLSRLVLADALRHIMGDRLTSVYYREMHGAMVKNGVGNGYLFGKPSGNIVAENGNRFFVDWEGGQKTGFFLDQRENRKLLEHYSNGKRILNMFGYTGGFSIYGLRGGAKLVRTVDSSASAIEIAKENVRLNFPSDRRHESFCVDVFDFFREGEDTYDIIILDPPAFAKGIRARKNALNAYRRINYRAFEKIEPGGLLFTFSCSQVVGREEFRQAVWSAAIQSGREIRILHQLSQPADHPVSIFHPEGEYLKGLVLQVS